MSFVWLADKPLLTEEQIARAVHEVSLSRELDELASVITLMGIRQESNFRCPWNEADPASKNYPYDSQSDDGRSVGYLQQQNGRPGDTLPDGDRDNWWGPMSCRMDLKCSVNTFQERLSDDYVNAKDGASAGVFVQNVQGSAYPDAYAVHWDYCWALLRRALAETPTPVTPITPPPVKPVDPKAPTPPVAADIKPNPAWRGDPLYLPELLKAFGLDVSTYTDSDGVTWDQRGHGDYGQISWVVWHHTGSVNETDVGIAHHPSLGLAANMLVHPDGHVTLTGSGISWNAGAGAYPGVPEDNINQICLGIECAYGPDAQGNYTIRWPDAQVIAMVAIGAAISWFLGDTLPPSHQIGHKEWAGADNPLGINKQGKPDPGNMDMDWFRGEITKRLAEGPTGVAAIGGKPPVTGGGGSPATGDPVPDTPQTFEQWKAAATDHQLLVWLVEQLGDGEPGWPSDGSTLRDKVWQLEAEIGELKAQIAKLTPPTAKSQARKAPTKRAPAKRAAPKKAPAKKPAS